MSDVRACRVCLTNEGRLDPPEKHHLQRAYENVTGIKLCNSIGSPQYLCCECSAMLRRFASFRSKCRRADATLSSIYNTNDIITQDDINSIDRCAANLSSSLIIHTLPPIEYNPNDEYFDAIKCEDAKTTCDYTLTEIKKEEETNAFSPLPDVDLNESDGSIKDEPLINYKLDAKKEKKIKAKRKDDCKKIKNKFKKSKKSSKQLVEKDLKKGKKTEYLGYYPRSYYEEFATITSLTPEQQIAEIESRKTTPNYLNSPHKCSFCYKGFVDEAAFRNHMFRHDPASGDYECDICRRRFADMNIMRKHIGSMHMEKISCNKCNHVCNNRCQARLHEMWHRGKVYECPHCAAKFPKFTTYMGHLRKKHPSQYICELCGNTFLSKKGITQHKTLVHHLTQQPEKLFGPYCGECDVTFADSDAYQRHFACSAKHSTGIDKMVSCVECGQLFESRAGVKLHMEGAHGSLNAPRQLGSTKARRSKPLVKDEGYPKKCVLCPQEVSSGREYWLHFRKFHKDKDYPKEPSSYTCEVCGRGFKASSLLRYHQRLHTGEKPFRCSVCGKSFRNRHNLTVHLESHRAERRYACAVCSKAFKTQSNLRKHLLVHEDYRFECADCGKKFRVPSELKFHHDHVHLGKPWPKRVRARGQSAKHPQS